MEIFNISKLKEPTVLIIHNPYSGKKKDDIRVYNETVQSLIKNGFEEKNIRFVASADEEQAARVIRNTGKSFLLSIGGDSTFGNALEANRKRGSNSLLQAHIPTGTTNDIGRTYGYTADISQTIHNIFHNGMIKEIDVFLLNGRIIAYVAGFGLLVTASYEATSEMKAKYGRKAYGMAIKDHIVSALYNEIPREHVIVEIDGKQKEFYCSVGLFSNSTSIAGMRLNHNGIKLDDGKFETLLCDARSFPELVASFPTFQFGINTPHAISIRTDNIKLTFDNSNHKPWCLDGDQYPERSSTYEIKSGGKMKLIVPEKRIVRI